MEVVIRRAVADDAQALVVLRSAMYSAMGDDVGGPDAAWRSAASAWFARALRSDGDALVVVADVPGEGPVSCALGLLQRRAPSPSGIGGVVGHVSQVSTLPEHRRRGFARACLVELLALFDDAGVQRVDLHATADGESLYRSLGFAPSPYPSLRRSRP